MTYETFCKIRLCTPKVLFCINRGWQSSEIYLYSFNRRSLVHLEAIKHPKQHFGWTTPKIMKKSRLLSRVNITNSGRRYTIVDETQSQRNITIFPADDAKISISFTNITISGYPFKTLQLSSSANTVTVNILLRELETSIDVNVLLYWVIAECFLGLPKRSLTKRIWIWLARKLQHVLIKFA